MNYLLNILSFQRLSFNPKVKEITEEEIIFGMGKYIGRLEMDRGSLDELTLDYL